MTSSIAAPSSWTRPSPRRSRNKLMNRCSWVSVMPKSAIGTSPVAVAIVVMLHLSLLVPLGIAELHNFMHLCDQSNKTVCSLVHCTTAVNHQEVQGSPIL